MSKGSWFAGQDLCVQAPGLGAHHLRIKAGRRRAKGFSEAQGLGFKVQGLRFVLRAYGSNSGTSRKAQSIDFKAQGSGFNAEGQGVGE